MATLIRTSLIASEFYCTTTISGDVIESMDEDTVSAILCTGISTGATNCLMPARVIVVRDTMEYVESLSDEELATLDDLLSKKELSLEGIEEKALEIEAPKVYQKK